MNNESVELTGHEIIDMHSDLKSMLEVVAKQEFAIAVARTLNNLEKEIKIFDKIIEPTEGFISYEKERMKLAMVSARKDKQGNPVIKYPENTYLIEDRDAFDEQLKLLKEKYSDTLEHRDNQINNHNKTLKDKCTIVLHKIDESHIPKKLTVGQTKSLLHLLD